MKIEIENKKIGPMAKKILLILAGGFALSLSNRPDTYFRILKSVAKEWQKINARNLRESVKRLYRSKLIDYKEDSDGTITLVLTAKGKNRILRYDMDKIKIEKPKKWDGLWRVVSFDIPEKKKQARNALVMKLKNLEFYPMQKSFFIFPFECKNQIDFIVEFFELANYVRFMRVKNIDIELDLKRKFNLL